jgi:iron complex outermembrane receptor protein
VPITFITDDALSGDEDEDMALYGEATFSVTDRLDLTLDVRVTEDDGRAYTYAPTQAFRTISPLIEPQGDSFAGPVATLTEDPDLGSITTGKAAISYQLTDDLMLYTSTARGSRRTGSTSSTMSASSSSSPRSSRPMRSEFATTGSADGCASMAPCSLLSWSGMRVQNLPPDPDNPGQSLPFPYPSSDGRGTADGFEADISWLATDRLRLNFGVGLLDTACQERGFFDGQNGIGPKNPFAYAPEQSASASLQYDVPMPNGGNLLLAGQYGWMGEYARDAANQRTPVDANGNPILEPAYGLLDLRAVYEDPYGNWNIGVWGRNLIDEQYVNGGFDTRFVWGYDFSVIGRSREIGVSLGFTF